MVVAMTEGAPWIGCIQMKHGQVVQAMYDHGGSVLGRHLRWGSVMNAGRMYFN